jgi:O-antigen/teichoic acid export membrane protein
MAMSGARWVTAGLVDQVVMASANAAMTLLPLGLLASEARAGELILSVGLGYLVLGLSREFVGSVLLAQASRLDGEERASLVRHGLAAAFSVGCVAAVVLLAIWEFWRRPGTNINLSDLVWLAPFLPVILLHDAGRYTYLSEREPAQALVIDLIWVGTQALVIVLAVATGHIWPGLLPVSWGIGACAGATAFLIRSGARPWRGDPRRWLAETRHLSGWFTATALVGQLHVQAIGFLVSGRLSSKELALLRSGQTAFLQPVQNFVTAMMGLLVPRSSRLAGRGDRAALHRQTARIAAGFAGLSVLMVAVVVPLAHLVLPHLHRYAQIAPLALPIAIQSGIYLLQIPFSAAVRGMQRARLLFFQYLIFSASSLTGLLIGASGGHLPSAVWGLVFGSATGLVVMILMYTIAARGLAVDASAGQDPSRDGVNNSAASPASR